MSEPVSKIVLPTRPQPDTIVAIFLLQKFGETKYPGIASATVAVDPKATPEPGALLLDVGGGELDHHGSDKCATELVATALGISENPAIRNLLAYARRDDTEGKGTVSNDPLDRAFGLSGLIAALNKQFPKEADHIVKTVLPLIDAHFFTANEHYVELPKLVAGLKQANFLTTETIQKPIRNCKIAFVTSNNVGLAGYLRSNTGGNYRVIVQRRSSGHVNILTKQNPTIDLSRTMALIRLHEANLRGVAVTDEQSLFNTGTHELIPNWYYDPATNSLLNGGVSPDLIEPTKIDWVTLKALILNGLQS
ncbi:MAG: hypothetical protein RLZZ480_701 [Candidatus Parcubacteria bacterium]|jgi:hypothetical protein